MDARSPATDAGVVERYPRIHGAERARRRVAAPSARSDTRQRGDGPMAAPVVNLGDVQGLVYSSYQRHPFAGFLFARFGDEVARSRAWLAGLEVTSAADRGEQ